MYIVNDVWSIIKEFIFHNIKKQGKHLKNDINIKNYNNVMKNIPIKTIPTNGPRIIYRSIKNDIGRRFIKYCYYIHTHLKRINSRYISYLMIETQILPFDYDLRDEYDEILRNEYYDI
jgi:hypothetical protein